MCVRSSDPCFLCLSKRYIYIYEAPFFASSPMSSVSACDKRAGSTVRSCGCILHIPWPAAHFNFQNKGGCFANSEDLNSIPAINSHALFFSIFIRFIYICWFLNDNSTWFIDSVWTWDGRSTTFQADDLQVSESDSEDYEKSEHEANMSSVVLKHVSKNASLAALAVACRSLCSPCRGNQCLECNTTMPTRPCVSVCYNYTTIHLPMFTSSCGMYTIVHPSSHPNNSNIGLV